MCDETEKTNPNTDYEILAKDIYQAIHDSEGFDTVNVKHNVKILGKSGCEHQIDVYWEFMMAGEKHRVAIECKNFASSVPVGRVRDFFGVLHDIGNIKGVFAAKEGYQSGAKNFANYYGISTKELRFPKPEDWEGRAKDLICKIIILDPVIRDTDIVFDVDWLESNTEIKEGDNLQFNCWENEAKIIDGEENQITTLYDIKNELPHNRKAEKGLIEKHVYEEAYLSVNGGQLMKIKSIQITYDIEATEIEFKTEGEAIAKAILRDVETGDIKFFDKHGNIK